MHYPRVPVCRVALTKWAARRTGKTQPALVVKAILNFQFFC